jgi:methylenetetrahydrofolate dehydrogenase (NADP+) / methenyltetrahydrofolate cyclohydrolase
MTTVIDGKKISADIKEELKNKISKLPSKPKLMVVLVGDDPASHVYVSMKERDAKQIGMDGAAIKLPEKTTQEELERTIIELNGDPSVHGILLQLPLPKHLDEDRALNLISPEKDVDGLHDINVGKLHNNKPGLRPCTPKGCMELLKKYEIPIEGKHAVVVGRSNLVGKPIARMLEQANATVTVCHSRTKNLHEVIKTADIVVVAIGRLNFVTGDMIKEGAVVIDVGINRKDDGKLAGDVEYDTVFQKASYITPVPGGVGPMTIAMLLSNTLEAYKAIKNSN